MDLDGEVPELRALASYYAGQGGALWAAEVAGRVVGMVGARPLGEGAWEVCKMYADAGQRGTGLAQALLGAAEGFARAAGGREMRLWSDTRFERAHRFYEKQGYVRGGPLRVLGDLSNSLEFAYAKPLAGLVVRAVDAAGAESMADGLAGLLRDCVAEGAALGFLPVLEAAVARGYWRQRVAELALGRRVLLAAWLEGRLAGCVMLWLEDMPDQPHVAHVEKLMVAASARRRGVGRRLMLALEDEARRLGRRLLTLSGRAGDKSEALYRGLGWTEYGRIAGFALNAAGGLEDEVLFMKRVD
jgi:GNAT superfamily N-acetyltransferase